MCAPHPDCPRETQYMSQYPPLEFEGDSDIAGIGVIISFLTYAVLTSSLACYDYFFVNRIETSHLHNKLDVQMREDVQFIFESIAELLFVPFVSRLSKLVPNPFRAWASKSWYKCANLRKEHLQAVCFQLADTQLITSASILIVLYLEHCTVTQYHFYIGSQLAYLSFITFQAIFMLVVDILHKRLVSRVWRYFWIISLFAAIVTAKLLDYNDYFLVDGLYGVSVQCAFDKVKQGKYYTPHQIGFFTLEFIVLLWGLWSSTVLLFPSIKERTPFAQTLSWSDWLLSRPSLYLARAKTTNRWKRGFLTVIFFVTISGRQILSSQIIHLLRLYLMLVWGGYGIFYQRDRAASQGRQGNENEWGFGQVLPLLLLALPFTQLAEEFWQTGESATNNRTTHEERAVQVEDYELEVMLSESHPDYPARSWTYPVPNRYNAIPPTPSHQAASDEVGDSRVKKDQEQIDELERQWFKRPFFRAWMFILLLLLYFVLTFLVIVFEVPI